MKAPVWKVRLIVLAAVCCCAALGAQPASAQSATVSPGSLVFGVLPVGTPSGAEPVSFTVTSGSVTINTIMIQGTNANDFSETDNCNAGTEGGVFGTGQGCVVKVTFTPAATGARTATLTFVTNLPSNPPPVILTGGVPAIKLFDSLLINPSLFSGTHWPGQAVRTNLVSLSCPASPLAKISSSTDGSGFVFQDNFIRVTNPASNTSLQNVCTGGDPNVVGITGTNCFQLPYESAVTGFVGKDPDTATVGEGGSFLKTYGVQPLDVSSVLAAGNQSVKFELMDAGGFLGASTINLVTNCTQAGVQSGGSVTSNPINPGDANSLTPTFAFDATAGQHIFFSANYLNGLNNNNGVTIQPNTIATVTDIGIAQKDFAALVAGTSAAPAVCLRYTGELASDGKTQLCKAFRLQCTNGSANGGSSTPGGINCPQSEIRNLLYETRFDSPDFPPGTNPIAEGTGPGFLMGPDVWNSAADCVFTVGKTTGQLCPQDPLTAFKGAADPDPGDTPIDCNSTFIAVLNMPLPFTETTVESANESSWQDETTVTVEFEAHPAVLEDDKPTSANGFKAAPIQSVTFGTTPANVPVPDPTFPVPGDQTLFSTGTCPNTTPGTFETTATFSLPEGRHKLHFFATDCASTEELRFQRSNDPNVNWAKFKTVAVNIDVSKPTPTIISLTPASPKDGQTVTVQFQCTDPLLADGTAGSGVVSCGPFHFAAVSDTGVLVKKFTADGDSGQTKTFSVKATDRAGNMATVSTNYTIQ
jgi:hypothetical protein